MTERLYDTHLGGFNGADMTVSYLDAMLAYSLKRGDVETARETMNTKWWDYRRVHPGKCLYLLCHLFVQARNEWKGLFGADYRHSAKFCDNPLIKTNRVRLTAEERAGGVLSYRTELTLVPTAIRTSMWRVMCYADHYGLPYEKWLAFGFQHQFDEKAAYLPLPVNLYGPRTVDYILERWHEDCHELMTLPKDPYFLAANYVGDPLQDEFQAWLLDLVRARGNPATTLANFLYNEPFAQIDKARDILGPEIVAEALARI